MNPAAPFETQVPMNYLHVSIPQTPTPQQLANVLEHLTGRPADRQEIAQVERQLEVPQQSYAPGGESMIPTRMVIK